MEREKKDKRKYIIIVLILLIAILTAAIIMILNQDQRTAVIVSSDEKLVANDGSVRISINPSIAIKKGTMQDIYFSNFNESRYLQCKIRLDDKYVYESQPVEPGQVIQADVIDDKNIKRGETEAVAEIYSFDMNKNPVGQTNVNILLKKE